MANTSLHREVVPIVSDKYPFFNRRRPKSTNKLSETYDRHSPGFSGELPDLMEYGGIASKHRTAVLRPGDSYDHVTQCFLSLSVHELDAIIRREHGIKFDLRNLILQNGYDTVIIAYAQSMIGRHVDPSTSGYRMYIFD